jgi:hypothetical protein
MNWLSNPLAQLAAAEAEWELQRDSLIVRAIAAQVRDLIQPHPNAAGSAGQPGWFGPARRAFDTREAELQAMLRLAVGELDALAAELRAASQRLHHEG